MWVDTGDPMSKIGAIIVSLKPRSFRRRGDHREPRVLPMEQALAISSRSYPKRWISAWGVWCALWPQSHPKP